MLAVPGILSVEALGKGPWWEAPFKVILPTHLPATVTTSLQPSYRLPEPCPPLCIAFLNFIKTVDKCECGLQVDYAPLLPEGPLKFFAVVAVGHALWGYLEYKRVQNFTSKGQVCASAQCQHTSAIPLSL